jgi:ribonuclease P protein component
VAFSIGRALGSAPTRNRLRRRLRAILHELEPALRPGALLIGAQPKAIELTFDQLRGEVAALMATAGTLEGPPCNA